MKIVNGSIRPDRPVVLLQVESCRESKYQFYRGRMKGKSFLLSRNQPVREIDRDEGRSFVKATVGSW